MNAPIPAFSPQWHTSLGMHRTSSPSPAVCRSAADSLPEYGRWDDYAAELASLDNAFLAPPFVSNGSEECTSFLDARCEIGQGLRRPSRDHNFPTGVGWGVNYGEEFMGPFQRPVSTTDTGVTKADWHSPSAVLRDVDDGKFIWDGEIRRTEETNQQRNNATHADPALIQAGAANSWHRGNDVNWLPNLGFGPDGASDSVEEGVTSSHSQLACADAPTKKRLGLPPGARNRKPSKARVRKSTAAPGSTSNGSQAPKRGAIHIDEEGAPTKGDTAWFHDAIRASIEENSNCGTRVGQDAAASGATSHVNEDYAAAQIDELRDACGRSRRSWICSICDKECHSKSRLQRHLYVHLKHVKFTCSCGQSFGRMDSMRIHRKKAGCVDKAALGK